MTDIYRSARRVPRVSWRIIGGLHIGTASTLTPTPKRFRPLISVKYASGCRFTPFLSLIQSNKRLQLCLLSRLQP